MPVVTSYELTVEVALAVPPAKAWKALVAQTAKWWPKHFYTGVTPKGFVVENELGGRVYDDWGGGAGALWGTVVVWQPPTKLVWACEMYPGWGGPGRSFVTFTVAAADGGSVVRLHDAGVCPKADKAVASLGDGWRELLGTYLKAFVEAR